MYKAEVVADSISPQGHRITSLQVTMPRIILAEFNTHRMLSRNSASSRAIPFPKMLRSVLENPFIPLRWMKDHSGMQGTKYWQPDHHFHFEEVADYLWERFKLKEKDEDFPIIRKILIRLSDRAEFRGRRTLTEWWLTIRDLIVDCAALLFCFNVSKQIVNRLLEPFMWHTVLVTATEWENFFALRAHPAAEIHMEHVANLVLETMNASTPVNMPSGGWHIPFRDAANQAIIDWHLSESFPKGELIETLPLRLKISTMMCARTSYTVPGGDLSEWTVEKYVQKHDDMVKSGHWSPFEHCAQCMNEDEYQSYLSGPRVPSSQETVNWKKYYPEKEHMGWCGNFRGWIQYRKTFDNENQSDNRLIRR